MPGAMCPFHTEEWLWGRRLADGAYAYVCERTSGHPGDAPWHWLQEPAAPEVPGLTGLAEELDLQRELPAALASLGSGWFEYGLVERRYAERRPNDWAQMVAQWGHTAIEKRQYSASSYLAGTLGRLSRLGSVAYHPGVGTGRWSYNSDISWWSSPPPGPWSERTSWVDVVQDADRAWQQMDLACKAYVPGA